METYINERVKPQRDWYEVKATDNKKQFMSYQAWIIVLGALIPVIVACESVVPLLKEYGGPITAIISAGISIYAGIDKLKQPQTNWFNYRICEELLKKEEWLYKCKAGPYVSLPSNTADTLFVERIESIISADITRTLSAKNDERTDIQLSPEGEPAEIPGNKPGKNGE